MARRSSNVLYLAPALANALFLYLLFRSTSQQQQQQQQLQPQQCENHRRSSLSSSLKLNHQQLFNSPHRNHIPLAAAGSSSSSAPRRLIRHPHFSPLPQDDYQPPSSTALVLESSSSPPSPSFNDDEDVDPFTTYLNTLDQEETSRSQQLQHALNQVNPVHPHPDKGLAWVSDNELAVQRVLVCLAEGVDGPSGCGENETRVALLVHPDFASTTNGASHGEVIWGEAVIHALKTSGYTVLIAPYLPDAIKFYAIFPTLIKVLFVKIDGGINYIDDCRNDPNCAYHDEENPYGIPTWKMVGFSYFGVGEERHPLGRAWVVTPIPVEGHTIIGSSIEHKCTATPWVPPSERKNQAFILGKVHSYFDRYEAAWTLETYQTIADETGLELVSVSKDDTEGRLRLPAPIKSLGSLSREDFLLELSQSKVLIGIGFPLVSPTPYEALCLGIPFLNPYDSTLPLSSILHPHPDDFNPRNVQHRPLFGLSPPQVYNVPRWNVTSLVDAVKQAVENPMEGRFVEEMVSLKGLRERLGEVMERDWEAFSREKEGERGVERLTEKADGERWSGRGKAVWEGGRRRE
ncbi:hypothetical protein BDY24DRAFT_412626 [Mrakia frigida]|uniref:uncharacterized protein n=1 Tax=Mrakia frigida TaxID=29902 RepID=UPI003FCC1B0F